MAQFLGFGNGSDGNVTLSGTDAPIDSACSGTSGTDSLSATNASFAAGQLILIITSRGTDVGQYEVNQIKSYVAGTITLQRNLTYSFSGLSQVIVIKQYNNVTISSTFTGKAWNGTTGGVITFACAGKLSGAGTLSASAIGFRATGSNFSSGTRGVNGEGTAGAGGVSTNSANGNGGGGGGGNLDAGHVEAGHGGGGGNGTAGQTPATRNTSAGGTGGSTSGNSDLSNMTFGGAGGEGGNGWDSGNGISGGAGGGAILLFVNELAPTGSIQANGQNGGNSGDRGGAGGGGGGGSIKIYYRTASIGTNIITATAGSGGTCTGAFGGSGGNGGSGRISLIGCRLTGTTNPTANVASANQSFCGRAGRVM